MTVTPPEKRQIRPCSACAFFVFTSDTGEGRCNLGKDEKPGSDERRWELSEISDFIHWPCMYNLTPEEIEVSVDSWVKSLVNESLRFRTSVQTRRSISTNRRKGNRKY
ncbi:hypothetical protein KHC33_09600 [Methanospirillum sp. J.3.6.1-F.2.7.3]|jgi:hypothetical protein|uniref:Uncharacterized protein n=2 Tax=Methanospirillum TaxID=2202 RepID=A0A8E7AWL5_9EURY|nr:MULTISPECIES: hypothetical protein [Methanospirillum]MDX8551046.1 hypothetical protein [Methanospirillum hungatei]NLW75336.1 hypothetical protein [Methanomicrobiales archaeon]QVV87619.1 hypothetical protein KHC33_09600 [Methanospirillum sp. J.3.6.1-F.2.7.3]QXO95083.1 hypothetical protein KSK55_01315 [Methanospirillum hungatei]